MKIVAQVTALVAQVKSEMKSTYGDKESKQINTVTLEWKNPTNEYSKNVLTLLNPDNALALGDAVQIVVTRVEAVTVSELQDATAPVEAVGAAVAA